MEKKKRKIMLITGIILVMLAELLWDELDSLLKVEFYNMFAYLPE